MLFYTGASSLALISIKKNFISSSISYDILNLQDNCVLFHILRKETLQCEDWKSIRSGGSFLMNETIHLLSRGGLLRKVKVQPSEIMLWVNEYSSSSSTVLLYYFKIQIFIWVRSWRPDWAWICHPPASSSLVLELQVFVTTINYKLHVFKLIN